MGWVRVYQATDTSVWSATRPESPRVVRFAVTPDEDVSLHFNQQSPDTAVSPDGEFIAYLTGTVRFGAERLHVRTLNQLTSETLVAEGELTNPFFSPDGESGGTGEAYRAR